MSMRGRRIQEPSWKGVVFIRCWIFCQLDLKPPTSRTTRSKFSSNTCLWYFVVMKVMQCLINHRRVAYACVVPPFTLYHISVYIFIFSFAMQKLSEKGRRKYLPLLYSSLKYCQSYFWINDIYGQDAFRFEICQKERQPAPLSPLTSPLDFSCLPLSVEEGCFHLSAKLKSYQMQLNAWMEFSTHSGDEVVAMT